jgi:SAM-dependent methyltransferase/peptidoglycan/xylan/chitin deacetylase (PgdA/CDA1 family)
MTADEILGERGQLALERLRSEVASWPNNEPLPEFFWRDDDVTRVVPSLEQFLRLSDRLGVPIVFAAIPTKLTSGAAQAIRASKHCRIAAHGFSHHSHVAEGEPDSEYPQGRDPATVLMELLEGQRLVKEKARERYLNMFVPPWGRFDRSYDKLLAKAGIVSFSGGATSPRFAVPIQWDCQILTEHGKEPLGLDVVLDRVARHLQLRRQGALPRQMPVGLITHHRTFGAELEAALETFLILMDEAGFRFSDFEMIDRAVAGAAPVAGTEAWKRTAPEARGDGLRLPLGMQGLAIADMLLERSLPLGDPGFAGLGRVLAEIGMTSAISVLRYTHLRDAVAALPAGARVLSAGCGKALAEVALAIANPEVSWLAVDVDPRRYQYAMDVARNVDVANIQFTQVDLNETDSWGFDSVNAIVVNEVAMYLNDPVKTLAALRRHVRPGGRLVCVEPFLATPEEPSVVAKLRQHTNSLHGGFTLEQMLSFVEGMEDVQHTNCYWHAPDQLLSMLWRHMSASGSWGLLDLMFAVAQLDLAEGTARHRREATAVKVVARAPAAM